MKTLLVYEQCLVTTLQSMCVHIYNPCCMWLSGFNATLGYMLMYCIQSCNSTRHRVWPSVMYEYIRWNIGVPKELNMDEEFGLWNGFVVDDSLHSTLLVASIGPNLFCAILLCLEPMEMVYKKSSNYRMEGEKNPYKSHPSLPWTNYVGGKSKV
jgi:hypothetical protein